MLGLRKEREPLRLDSNLGLHPTKASWVQAPSFCGGGGGVGLSYTKYRNKLATSLKTAFGVLSQEPVFRCMHGTI